MIAATRTVAVNELDEGFLRTLGVIRALDLGAARAVVTECDAAASLRAGTTATSALDLENALQSNRTDMPEKGEGLGVGRMRAINEI